MESALKAPQVGSTLRRPGLSGRFSSQSKPVGKDYVTMIRLYAYVGELSEDELDFLIDNLEEEWSDDRDYYIN